MVSNDPTPRIFTYHVRNPDLVQPMLNRGDMRAKYHLEGNGCTDCLCACCCTPCDITQQDKEAQFREEQNRPLMAQPDKVGGMTYAPQQQNPAFHTA